MRKITLFLLLPILATKLCGADFQPPDLVGTWTGKSLAGSSVTFNFQNSGSVIWTDDSSAFKTTYPSGLRGTYSLTEDNPSWEIDLKNFTDNSLQGIIYQGILEPLSHDQFKLEGRFSSQGGRPLSFDAQAIVFSRVVNQPTPGPRVSGSGIPVQTNPNNPKASDQLPNQPDTAPPTGSGDNQSSLPKSEDQPQPPVASLPKTPPNNPILGRWTAKDKTSFISPSDMEFTETEAIKTGTTERFKVKYYLEGKKAKAVVNDAFGMGTYVLLDADTLESVVGLMVRIGSKQTQNPPQTDNPSINQVRLSGQAAQSDAAGNGSTLADAVKNAGSQIGDIFSTASDLLDGANKIIGNQDADKAFKPVAAIKEVFRDAKYVQEQADAFQDRNGPGMIANATGLGAKVGTIAFYGAVAEEAGWAAAGIAVAAGAPVLAAVGVGAVVAVGVGYVGLKVADAAEPYVKNAVNQIENSQAAQAAKSYAVEKIADIFY